MIFNVNDRIKFHLEPDMVSGEFTCDFSIIIVLRINKIYMVYRTILNYYSKYSYTNTFHESK